MSKLTTYNIERPVRNGGELQREGTIDLSDKDAKPLLDCGAISDIKTAGKDNDTSTGGDNTKKNDGGTSGEGTSGAPDQNNPNRTTPPDDPEKRLALIRSAIRQMEINKVKADWTKQSGPQLKPLAEVVGFEVKVDERNQAFEETRPEEAK